MAHLADRRDYDFLLYEVLNVESLSQYPYFSEHNREIFDLILDTAFKFAHEVIAPTNVPGDREGATYDPQTREVKTPEAFHGLLEQMREGGWLTLDESYDVGGQQLPHVVGLLIRSIFGSANLSFNMLPGLGHGAAKMVEGYGTDRQKRLYMQPMFDGVMGGTMCLTEAGAGSDVGALTTTATPNEDGTYNIKGSKIFITWGEHDLTENICYPVLARIEGDPAGTKGISLFLVTKYKVNEDGTPGERNDVYCAGIEEKLGIHGSPTSQMVFGENDQCVGELLGEPCKGMRIMFEMMNGARIAVGMQGLCLAEPAYHYAFEYATERKQGSSIEEFKNPEAPRVPIVVHPDVRRMLMDMQASVEGMRALLAFAAMNLDVSQAASEGAEQEKAQDTVDLLTPIVKSWCTDTGFDVTTTAIQVLGGHGYLQDHPLEQYLRDMKIGSLYEGTNGIQAMDLLGRKLGLKGGQVLMNLLTQIDETVERVNGNDSLELTQEAERVEAARNALAQSAVALGMKFQQGDLEGPLLNATPFLNAMSETVVGWLLLWEAEVAQTRLFSLADEAGIGADGRAAYVKTNASAAFYDGKVKTAQHFINRTLPITLSRFSVIDDGDRSALDAVLGEDELASTA